MMMMMMMIIDLILLDYDWEEPTSVRQCQDCLINYGAVNSQIWPMDYTDRALHKVYVKYGWFAMCQNETERVKLIRMLFNNVLQVGNHLLT